MRIAPGQAQLGGPRVARRHDIPRATTLWLAIERLMAPAELATGTAVDLDTDVYVLAIARHRISAVRKCALE